MVEAAEGEAAERLICEALTDTLFVEAGAGTGKTRALVDRVVSLVAAERRIDRIVAITFTEKAAAELRDRVREGLERRLAESDANSACFAEAISSLDRAQISTIHAFCHSLLRSFAAEAGVDPSFEVQDELMAERRLQERWREYLESLGEDTEAVTAIDRILGLGMTPRELERLMRAVMARGEIISRWKERPLAAAAPFWQDIQQMYDRIQALNIGRVAEQDPLRLKVERVMRVLEDVLKAGRESRESVLASGAAALAQKFGVGRAGDWDSQIGEVRAAAEDVCKRLMETLNACRSEALADVMPLIVRFAEEDAERRGREGVPTFDDLILRVRDLLWDDEQAARVLRQRYDALLIDEFQDTDPLQTDIALRFACDPATGELEPGRLFVVGDPKQSIYRFRRADMAVYSRTRSLIGEQRGSFPLLSQNRRARAPLIAWVNLVFQRIIGEGERPAVQPPYRPIQEERATELSGPGIGFAGEALAGNAREVRQAESGAVAELCRLAVADGWEVYDREREEVRPARFADIAILIPARTVLPALERALAEAQVPSRVEGGSLIYKTQEIRDIINCLTAIDDPADEVAIVGALRSPAFACSDVDLARYKAAGGYFDYSRKAAAEAEGPVGEALGCLARYHERRHQGSLAALVEAFVAERGQVETGVLDTGDRSSFRRMRFIAEQARAFERADPQSLRAFVSWLEGRSAEQMKDDEGAGLDDDEDAVRVLTIHGAKGLEFPIVFLAGMSSAPQGPREILMVDHESGDAAICLGAKEQNRRFELGRVDELAEIEKSHAKAEFARMLYVAATRARDHLVISCFQGARSAGSGGALFIENGGPESGNLLDITPSGGTPVNGLSGLDLQPVTSSIEEFERGRQALVSGARRLRFTSATAEVRAAELKKEETHDETEPWARGRGGTSRGRAVHAAIQSLPWDAGEEMIAAFSRAQAVAEAIPGRADEVQRLVRKALASGAAARARAAVRALREVPFAVRLADVLLEGFIDVVIENGDGIEIVDWKTDRVSASEVPSRLEEYRLQAGLYVIGMREATGRPVTAVTYVFVEPGLELSPGEPDELAASAREHLRRSGALA